MPRKTENRIQRLVKTPIGTFSYPDAKFKHVHIEIIRSLPSYQGHSCIQFLTDFHVGLPKLHSKTYQQFNSQTQYQKIGYLPLERPTTSPLIRARNFDQLFQEFSYLLGAKHFKTTSYANRLMEIFHRQPKKSSPIKQNSNN